MQQQQQEQRQQQQQQQEEEDLSLNEASNNSEKHNNGDTDTNNAPWIGWLGRCCLECEATDHREDATYCWSCGSEL
jgi:hypothetical protein